MSVDLVAPAAELDAAVERLARPIFDTDEPARMAGSAPARLRARRQGMR
jgi:hypothetical protein